MIIGIMREIIRIMQEVIGGIRCGIMRSIRVRKMRGISHDGKESCQKEGY
jgi:hypothetical protein